MTVIAVALGIAPLPAPILSNTHLSILIFEDLLILIPWKEELNILIFLKLTLMQLSKLNA